MADRYDARAWAYQRWWGPVIAPAALTLLDLVASELDRRPQARVLDLGTGTGTLARGLLRRWPTANVTGVDLSAGMLEVARDLADGELHGESGPQLELVHGDLEDLPFPDATFDLAVASFVLQLVTDRDRALQQAHRVLRPGGRFVSITWLIDVERFRPADEFDEAVVDLEIEEDDAPEDGRAGDFRSARAATEQLRRAGFIGIKARRAWLEHPFTLDSYLDYKEHYDELDLFGSLVLEQRRALRARAAERLARLDGPDFIWRQAIVRVTARRP